MAAFAVLSQDSGRGNAQHSQPVAVGRRMPGLLGRAQQPLSRPVLSAARVARSCRAARLSGSVVTARPARCTSAWHECSVAPRSAAPRSETQPAPRAHRP
jgi:hypothetical protein